MACVVKHEIPQYGVRKFQIRKIMSVSGIHLIVWRRLYGIRLWEIVLQTFTENVLIFDGTCQKNSLNITI